MQLIDGTYYMIGVAEMSQILYTAPAPKGPWTILTSPFQKGAPGSWNTAGTMGKSGLDYIGDVWYMFMAGLATPAVPEDAAMKRHFEIGLAISLDALAWYGYPNNPIIPLEKGSAYDNSRLSEVGVHYENGIFYATYTAVKQPANPTACVRAPDTGIEG